MGLLAYAKLFLLLRLWLQRRWTLAIPPPTLTPFSATTMIPSPACAPFTATTTTTVIPFPTLAYYPFPHSQSCCYCDGDDLSPFYLTPAATVTTSTACASAAMTTKMTSILIHPTMLTDELLLICLSIATKGLFFRPMPRLYLRCSSWHPSCTDLSSPCSHEQLQSSAAGLCRFVPQSRFFSGQQSLTP